MFSAYKDMREANWKEPGTDKYFHARGNYDAAQRGPGGKWAAEVIRWVILLTGIKFGVVAWLSFGLL